MIPDYDPYDWSVAHYFGRSSSDDHTPYNEVTNIWQALIFLVANGLIIYMFIQYI
jgi:hypothetical protein